MQTRRRFVITGALASATSALGESRSAKAAASERIRIGIMGAGGRALALIQSFAANPNIEIVGIAEVDSSRLPAGLEAPKKHQITSIRPEADFRRLIDDRSIDALVIGTPDHWHAIPTILACQAGKDVYVEKPDAHNIVEGQAMVKAMRKHGRIVQLGSQHRSTTRLQSAIDYVSAGHLGRCLVAKAWESTRQGPIGFPKDEAVPKDVDYDMWLGPAPKRPFNRNRFHSRWRWFFDYGTGDLGNDGVHRLDMALALLDAAAGAQREPTLGLPRTISAGGGKWYFDDAQEFADTLQITYSFGHGRLSKILTYEMRIWAPYKYLGEPEGAAVFGDRGYIVIGNNDWVAYGQGGQELARGSGDSSEIPHVQNFVDCIKSRNKPNCDLETIGHVASVLCHTGNIASRVGRTLTLDPETEQFINDGEANELRGRTSYRAPWLLPDV